MIQRTETNARMSQCVQFQDTIYLSGQTAAGPDVTAQTQGVLDKIEGLLKKSHSSPGHVLSATIHLADMADFAAMNAVWDGWFAPERAPARTAVQAKLARPEVRVEITIIAATAFERE